MKLIDLKNKIEKGKPFDDDLFLIFKFDDADFISKQYIRQIAKLKNLIINPVDELTINNSKDLFELNNSPSYIRVYECVDFDCNDVNITREKNLFIICKKIKNEKLFENYTISLPRLEHWQIIDYVNSVVDGVSESDLEYLVKLCNYNIDRIEQEIKKLLIFDKKERQTIFNELKQSGAFDDLSTYNIFNFTDALLTKNTEKLYCIYKEIERIAVDPYAVTTIMYKNIKNVSRIQLSRNPSPAVAHMDKRQFYAIQKNVCGHYSSEQLVDLFTKITNIDKKLKSGYIPENLAVDYILQLCYAV